ncbi:MAG: phosphoribosylamine--glycine ligase [Bacteroidetes bacterium]|nr:phosphoribosylamine--glycine ligase [Bacteroidota bacterium]
MKILILGSGGRESAFAWKLNKELPKENIFIAPGNAGTLQYGTNVNLNLSNFEEIGKFCIENNIDTLLPGGEDTLVGGIRNFFENHQMLKNIYVFGPDERGAMLEGSKDFSKNFMTKYNIPTAKYKSFVKGEEQSAFNFLETLNPPYVIKADGLAAGKGVIICQSLEDARDTVNEMLLQNMFGKASNKIVIEEFLNGIEVSFFAISDGSDYILLPEAKDYKKIGENDTGPNTGGMGAVSPVLFADENFKQKVIKNIINPTFNGLKNENIDYVGFVFFGLIKVGENPFVIEYNCRMGDPETEVVLPRLKNSLSEIISFSKHKKLNEISPEFVKDFCSTVMLVSKGYPGNYEKGKKIEISNTFESIVFHAGTINEGNYILTNGGRVLAVSSFGSSLSEALDKSYKSIEKINFEGINFRRDIGQDLIKLEVQHGNY